MTSDALRICLLTYRGNPTCGGQGIYIKYLSRALRDQGHQVDVISGPPYPELSEDIPLHSLPGLDLYNPDHLFKVRNMKDLKSPINQLEFLSMCLGGFPEPLTFGFRVFQYFRRRMPRYDIVHDNQSLSYGILGLKRLGYRTVATMHHPITVDRNEEIRAARSWIKKIQIMRWYSFIGMQKRVSRRMTSIITVSECSKKDILSTFRIPAAKFHVVPNGINTDHFYPISHITRTQDQIITTNSADTPLKGLKYLLYAVAAIRKERSIKLVVIGMPKNGSTVHRLVKELNISDCVIFTGRIKNEDFASYYAKAAMAVIPSLYEGFGMPAGEAMACGVPVICTAGGALPEVVGDAGIIVPPGDDKALEKAIVSLLDNPERRQSLSQAGLERVKQSFTWQHAARKTVEVYREAIHVDN